jgi:hypothetical protein
MPIKPEHLDELLAGYEKPEDLLGEEGLFKRLKKALLERALGRRADPPSRLRKGRCGRPRQRQPSQLPTGGFFDPNHLQRSSNRKSARRARKSLLVRRFINIQNETDTRIPDAFLSDCLRNGVGWQMTFRMGHEQARCRVFRIDDRQG